MQAVAIGGDVAAEAPLLAQHAIEQPRVHVRWNSVDLVIGSHHAADVRFFDRGLKRHQKIFANDALGIIAGRGVGAALGLAMHGEMLSGRNYVVPIY